MIKLVKCSAVTFSDTNRQPNQHHVNLRVLWAHSLHTVHLPFDRQPKERERLSWPELVGVNILLEAKTRIPFEKRVELHMRLPLSSSEHRIQFLSIAHIYYLLTYLDHFSSANRKYRQFGGYERSFRSRMGLVARSKSRNLQSLQKFPQNLYRCQGS